MTKLIPEEDVRDARATLLSGAEFIGARVAHSADCEHGKPEAVARCCEFHSCSCGLNHVIGNLNRVAANLEVLAATAQETE